MTTYPDPPWHTHGRAFMQPYLVRASDVRVPAPLEVESHFGMATGLLGYVVYEAPSPLLYGELIWMPCRVKARTHDGKIVRGFYVEKMYVDLEASLRAGQQIWALPKQLATFREREGEVHVETEDGVVADLAFGTRGFAVTAGSKTVTLQTREGTIVRFVGETTRAKASAGYVSVRAIEGASAWSGFATARRLSGAGVALARFETTMCAPEILRAG